MSRHARPRGEGKARRWTPWRVVQSLIATLLFCALPILAFYPWAYWGQGLDGATVSRRLETVSKIGKVHEEKDKAGVIRDDQPPAETSPGEGKLIGWMRIPRIGRDYRLPIQEGTTQIILDNMGSGHYERTAMPGQPGNSAYAGHATYSDFADIRLLRPGDQIIVETGDNWYVYSMASSRIVDEHDTGILASDGANRTITLTTCWPVLTTAHTEHRLVVKGDWVGWMPKTDGTPASLTGTRRTVTEQLKRHAETISERVGMPVTGVAACCLALMWLILNGFNWLISHRRMRDEWRLTPPSDPFSLIWMLNAGWFPSHPVLFKASRMLPMLLLYGALLFASWRWACPWMADHLQWLLGSYPHPPA